MAAVERVQVGDRATKVSFPASAMQNACHAPSAGIRARSVAAGGLMAALSSAACRGALVVLVTVTSLALVGCSGGGSADPDPPVATPRSPASATSPAPSPEELAAEAAVEAVAAMVQVQDAAKRDPTGRDWEPEIRRVASDPFAAIAVESIRTYATGGIRQVGDSVVEPEVTGVDLAAVEGLTVLLIACYDSTGSDIVRVDNGESILGPDEPRRFVWNLTVVNYESEPGEPWKVTVLEPLPDQPC